jgi:hypothetical protein
MNSSIFWLILAVLAKHVSTSSSFLHYDFDAPPNINQHITISTNLTQDYKPQRFTKRYKTVDSFRLILTSEWRAGKNASVPNPRVSSILPNTIGYFLYTSCITFRFSILEIKQKVFKGSLSESKHRPARHDKVQGMSLLSFPSDKAPRKDSSSPSHFPWRGRDIHRC